MNDQRLQIYLNDHLALLVGELELVKRCRKSNRQTPLAECLERIEAELTTQKATLEEVLQRIGGAENHIKQGAAWLAEKLGRFKLNDSLLKYSDLSRLIELEALAAAAQERLALWETLDVVAPHDARLEGIDFSSALTRTGLLLDELIQQRRNEATWTFTAE